MFITQLVYLLWNLPNVKCLLLFFVFSTTIITCPVKLLVFSAIPLTMRCKGSPGRLFLNRLHYSFAQPKWFPCGGFHLLILILTISHQTIYMCSGQFLVKHALFMFLGSCPQRATEQPRITACIQTYMYVDLYVCCRHLFICKVIWVWEGKWTRAKTLFLTSFPWRTNSLNRE